jgi:hypothetical protein
MRQLLHTRFISRIGRRTHRAIGFISLASVAVVVLVSALGPLGQPTAHAAAQQVAKSLGQTLPDVGFFSHARPADRAAITQDPRWVALKLAHKIHVPGQVYVPACTDPCPTGQRTLATSVVENTVEALGNNGTNGGCVDDDYPNPTCYIDNYFWNFCGAGAADNALYYWNGKTNTYPAGWYTEPPYSSKTGGPTRWTSTYWTSSDQNRSYEMYLADQVQVPGWSTPGMVTFYGYNSAGTFLADMTNTLNWEASGHSTTNWQNFFYLTVYKANLSAATLNTDIMLDINAGRPVVAAVNTLYLPNWEHGVAHMITIIGFNNNTGQYVYTDTCGTACGSD